MINKLCQVGLSLLLVLSTVFANMGHVFAANYSLSNDGNFYIQYKSNSPHDSEWHISSGIWTLDKEKVFCIEYDVATEVGLSYTPSQEYTQLTQNQRRYVQYLAYFGYGYHDDLSYERYAATQFAIWNYIDGYSFSFKAYDDSMPETSAATGKKNHRLNYDQFIKAYNEIRQLAKTYYDMKKPSFHNTMIKLKGVGENYAVELTDTQDVLSQYESYSGSGLQIKKSGNTLKIWTDTLFDGTKTYQYVLGDLKREKAMGKPIIYTSGNSQKLLRAGFGDFDLTSIKVSMSIGSLVLAKKDSYGEFVPQTTFQLSYHADMSEPLGTYTTGNDGTVTIKDLSAQKVYIKEMEVPEHLVLDSTIHEVTVKEGETITYTQTNQWKQGYIRIVKKDAESGKTIKKAGTVFDVYNDKHQKIETIETDHQGVAQSSLLDYGIYYVREIKAPLDYMIQVQVSENVSIIENQKIYDIVVEDQPVKGQIVVEKKGEVLVDFDSVMHQFVYETRGLIDAKYNIYAKEDIVDSSNGDILYKKGSLVESLTTNQKGQAISSKLPLGKYEVVEMQAPKHMVLNKEHKEVELRYKDQYTEIVMENKTFVNERQKVNAKLKKVNENNIGLKNAQFQFIAKNDIYNIDGKRIVKAGTILNQYSSDQNGNIILSNMDLPLDTYFQLIETKAPTGYILNTEPVEYYTKYMGQNIETIELSQIKKNESTKVSISKRDITTSQELPGNHMIIFEKEDPTKIIESWVSENKPHDIENLSIYTRYILKETSAVKGFSIANDIEFEIDEQGKIYVYQDGQKKECRQIIMENDLVTGCLRWNKTGKIFTHTLSNATEFGIVEDPVWKESNILQSEITIYAAQDIILGNGITYYHKDEKIQTLKSGWQPIKSKELLVGKYYYVETQTPYGYVGDTNKHYFEIVDNHSQELQIIDSTLNNERPKVIIDLTKSMETAIYHDKIDHAYEKVIFGIFANEDIYNYMGEVAIRKDAMVAITGIDERGQLKNIPDLPEGVYYLKELATHSDYVLDQNHYVFEVSYHGQDVSEYIVKIGNDGLIENKLIRGSIQIKKSDSFDETKKLQNIAFHISVHDDMSEILKTVETDENGIAYFNDLEIGTYYIQEVKQADGYIINDHIYKVDIAINGEIVTIHVENQPTEMEFTKVDETGESELSGAHIEIIEKETGKKIDSWISTNESHKIQYLVEGKEYIMRETLAPFGFAIAQDIEFIAGHGQKVVMKNELKTDDVMITKYDLTSHEELLGAHLQVIDKNGKVIDEWVSTHQAHIVRGLYVGHIYTLREIKAPEGYHLAQDIEFMIQDNGKLMQKVNIYDQKIVKTTDQTHLSIYIFMIIMGMAGFILIKKQSKSYRNMI